MSDVCCSWCGAPDWHDCECRELRAEDAREARLAGLRSEDDAEDDPPDEAEDPDE